MIITNSQSMLTLIGHRTVVGARSSKPICPSETELTCPFIQARFVFGASPTKLYTDSSLYNLYGHAYKQAGFESSMKAHFARHMLGYRQARLGSVESRLPYSCRSLTYMCVLYSRVDASQTSKLGWSKDTFADTYAPQLPKTVNYTILLPEFTAIDQSPSGYSRSSRLQSI